MGQSIKLIILHIETKRFRFGGVAPWQCVSRAEHSPLAWRLVLGLSLICVLTQRGMGTCTCHHYSSTTTALVELYSKWCKSTARFHGVWHSGPLDTGDVWCVLPLCQHIPARRGESPSPAQRWVMDFISSLNEPSKHGGWKNKP